LADREGEHWSRPTLTSAERYGGKVWLAGEKLFFFQSYLAHASRRGCATAVLHHCFEIDERYELDDDFETFMFVV